MLYNSILITFLCLLATTSIVLLVVHFIKNLIKYDYIGNIYLYIGVAYFLCLLFALYAIFNLPTAAPESFTISIEGKTYTGNIQAVEAHSNAFILLVSSLFDALKMMAAAFDRSIVNAYLGQNIFNSIFAIYYTGVSFFALITTSITTILFVVKSFGAKLANSFRLVDKSKNIYYIFSDPQVLPSIKLAEELKNDKNDRKSKNIVIMYIPSSCLKTQAGTEYRDVLKNAGFDVRAERFSKKLCTKIFNKHFNPQFDTKTKKKSRKVTVYGLFSDDELSTQLAINFTKAINDENFQIDEKTNKFLGNNNNFKKIYKKYADSNIDLKSIDSKQLKEDIEKLDSFKVFVTYQDADIDISHNFSGKTLHIVNTLSQYDMISSEFALNNPLTNFLSLDKVENCEEGSLNVTFVGFGKINKPIFEKLSYAYQLWGDKKYLINYHILDKNAESLAESYSNEFTRSPLCDTSNQEPINNGDYLEKPQLYNLDLDCDNRDLSSYETINNHIKSIQKNKGRFSLSGFEIFIISLSKTNTDVQVALNLRNTLLRTIDQEKLRKTIIFVRIADQTIVDNLKSDTKFVIDQKKLNSENLGNILDGENEIIDVPIVIFGQNTMMSDYIENHFNILDKLGVCVQNSYNRDEKDDQTREVKTLVEWINMKKIDVLCNIALVYTLKTKLQIFGYKYNGNFDNSIEILNATKGCIDQIESDIKKCKSNFIRFNSSNEGKSLMKLAESEHNRWMATEYLYHKYGQLKKADYFSKTNLNKNSYLKTKNSSRTRHICMTTNEGLKALFKQQTENDYGENPINRNQNCIKLVFENDILTIIEVLNYFKLQDNN